MAIVSSISTEEMRLKIRKKSQLKGRQVEESAQLDVLSLVGQGPYRRDLLIEYLHLLNDQYQGLHHRHLVALAKAMTLPMAEVFEVASFYHHFEIIREGEHAHALTIRVCDGLSCELAGAQDLLQKLPTLLGSDQIQIIAAPCVGRCEHAPVAVVHQNPIDHASPERVEEAVREKLLHHEPHAHEDVEVYVKSGGYALLQRVVAGSLTKADILTTLENSGLRGLGGAGFPVGRKWRIVGEQPAPRLMAVNIDEGEPGTFKDRTYLERDPHRFLEGMLIAAHVVGIDAIYIYLRDEYHGCREMLSAELARLKAHPPCDLPTIELRRGAGAYICGEESAMIESIEGKRGEPRMRPPYIAEVGLFGRPTLEHNPGVKLAPAGITIQELIDEHCGGMLDGHTFYAYLPGGASGGILPASLNQVPLDFDTLQPHGSFIGSAAVIVLGHQDSARAAALNMMRFFKNESCGQCTPCRVGTAKAAALMQARVWDRATLTDLNQVMLDASICGLGQAAPNPVQSVLNYFSHEVV